MKRNVSTRRSRPGTPSPASPIAVVLNRDGIFLYANPALAQLLATPREQLQGRSFEDFVMPRQRRRYRELLDAGGPEGGALSALTLCRPDGQPVPSQVCVGRLEPPEPEWIMLIAVDVTKQQRLAARLRREKQALEKRVEERTVEMLRANRALEDDMRRRETAEAALRTSEAKWRALFEVCPAVIVMTTPEEGRILEVNEAFLRILGYRRDEVIGRTVGELGAWGLPARREAWVAQLRRCRSMQNAEAQVTTKTGEVRMGLVSSALLDIEGHERLLTVIMDITDRTRAEDALRLSEERFTKAFRSCPAAMALSRTHDGCFVDVNDAFVTMTGYRREEVVGAAVPVWRNPADRQEAVRDLLAAGSLRTREYDFLRKSGDTIHGLAGAELVEVAGERLILSLVLDITERKRAEEELRRALRDKETLIQEVHHRVKNNLQMLCDMLFLQAELLQEGDGKAALQDAYSRVFAIARLHEQLYQSLESGRVHLGEYLGRLVAGFSNLSANIPIVLDAGADAILLEVDRAIHAGLLVNELVTNALKHAFPPGGTGEVAVRVRRIGGDVELQIRDTGKGLPADLVIGEVRSLGLRIVQILSSRLGATLRVETAGGTCFALRFPILASE